MATDAQIPDAAEGCKTSGTLMYRRKEVRQLFSKILRNAKESAEQAQAEGRHTDAYALAMRIKAATFLRYKVEELPQFIQTDFAPADRLPGGLEMNERAQMAVKDSGCPAECEPAALQAVLRFIGDIRIPIEDLREYEFEDEPMP